MLVAAALLVVDLFLTWQSLEVDFGPPGTATSLLDGWDAWGLLIALVEHRPDHRGRLVVYASDIEISRGRALGALDPRRRPGPLRGSRS